MMWPLPTMEADCIDRSICMRLATLHLVALLSRARRTRQRPGNRRCGDGSRAARLAMASRQHDLPKSSRDSDVSRRRVRAARYALEALGADELLLRRARRGLRAVAAKASQDQARTTAEFHRMGGVFVLPAVINGGTKSYFIVDSGAANVQIPEEVADEMKRAGTLADFRFPGPKAIHARRRQRAAAAGVPAEEPADRRPDDGERPGRRRRTEEPGVAGPKLPASTELVEDRQCEERDGVRIHRVILEAPPAPSGAARQNRDRDARPRAGTPTIFLKARLKAASEP